MLKRQNNINYFLTDFNNKRQFYRYICAHFCAYVLRAFEQKRNSKKRLLKKCARKKHAKTLVKSTLGLSFNYLFALSTKFL